jgi:competence protein ComEC
LKNSPALLIFIAISIEIACFNFVKNPVLLVIISIIAVSSACFLFRAKAKNTLLVFIIIILLTILCSSRIALILTAPSPQTGRVEFNVVVTMSNAFGRGQALIVQSSEGDFVIKRPVNEIYKLGETLAVKGWIKPFQNVQDNSKFNEATFWKSKGVLAEIVASSIKKEASQGHNLHSLRQIVHDRFKLIPMTMRGYLDAMWTGIKDSELNEMHQRWGTSHLLAVSGFHVGLVAGIVECIFYFFRFRSRIRGIILSFFVWMYIFISGAAPSAMRAAFMFQVGIFAGVLGRRVYAVNSVAVAASVMLLYSPFLFWNVGWRLSVIAAFTITALSSLILDEKLGKWTWVMIPSAVYLTTYPVVSSVFESVPVVGIIINIIAVPFFAFVFPFISLVALLGIMHNVTDACLRLYGYISDFLAWIFPWRLPYNSFFSMFCVLFFYWLIYTSLREKKRSAKNSLLY